ncbi:MAG TPA: hypothetical protein VEV83_10635 [Parafilimonas sp.]|nr:hypothetical protein [Parafilimonas sp.]
MGNLNHTDSVPVLRSRLSFQPLMRAWQEEVQKKTATEKMYLPLLQELLQHQELLAPIDDFRILHEHKNLIEQIAAAIFPVSLRGREKLYAIADPSCYKTVFASDPTKQIVPSKRETYFQGKDDEIKKNIVIAKLKMAYKLILDKFYNVKLAGDVASIYAVPDLEKGLNSYLGIELDPYFVDVSCCGDLPVVDADFFRACFTVDDVLRQPALYEKLPLNEFIFDGIVIVYINDVTETQAIRSIKQMFKDPDFFSFRENMVRLQQETRFLLDEPGVFVGITPLSDGLYSNNGKPGNSNSLFAEQMQTADAKAEVCGQLTAAFKASETSYLFFDRTNIHVSDHEFVKNVGNRWSSGFLFPLHGHQHVIGSLEVFSENCAPITARVLPKLEPLIELAETALLKNVEHLENEVNKIIKEQFTPVHPAVEWKFADAATRYFFRQKNEPEPKMEPIKFEDVHPLYGAIDIKNSSGQRNLSVQLDLSDQLGWVKQILNSALPAGLSSLLKETRSKIDTWSDHINIGLSTDDEQDLLNFLKGDIANLLHHLEEMMPAIGPEIRKYFDVLDPDLHILNNHRKKFDDSINRINATLARFFEREQREAQKIYPHYFERFITDGIEFNIYVGHAIAPQKKFNDIYLKNIKLWQMKTMTIAAQRISRIQQELAVPLQTTQLILVYSKPISISFRSLERRFDVDGGYNVRYEVIKKRIDKVRLKNAGERLTKPGTIAIVYTQSSEAEEYIEYIGFLKTQNLLRGPIEQFELEELQGVGALKGLRVGIVFDEPTDRSQQPIHN